MAAQLLFERAAAVRKPARGMGDVFNLHGATVHDAHRDDRLADLLTVRSDVLDRRGADVARDPRKTLESGPPLADGAVDQRIELFAGSHAKLDRFTAGFLYRLHAVDSNAQNQTVEAA